MTQTHWLDLPAARLDQVPHSETNAAVGRVVAEVAPELLFVPHPGDMHLDHFYTFVSSLVASRPHQQDYPATLLAYETVSETNWNAAYLTPAFVPNVFVDITDHIEAKLAAFGCFASQVKAAPHERSMETLRALATLRGATVHRGAAEAFVLVRSSV